jgi:hypothetical protein
LDQHASCGLRLIATVELGEESRRREAAEGIIRRALELIRASNAPDVTLVVVGRKARDFYRRRPWTIKRDMVGFWDRLAYTHASELADYFMQQYLDLAKKLMLGFGLVFELPLLIFFLSWIGMVTHRGLWKFNRWAIVLAFVIGAILTPTPDVVSQTLMAGPLIILYELGIISARLFGRPRQRVEAAVEQAGTALAPTIASRFAPAGGDGVLVHLDGADRWETVQALSRALAAPAAALRRAQRRRGGS